MNFPYFSTDWEIPTDTMIHPWMIQDSYGKMTHVRIDDSSSYKPPFDAVDFPWLW